MGRPASGGKKLSRRDLLRAAGAGGAGLAFGAGGYAALRGAADARDALGDEAAGILAPEIPFYGSHQAGIATPQQEHLHFAALDLVSESVAEVRDLLMAWSEAGRRMAAGEPAGGENESPFLPPDDTGEAFGLSPARLTLTFGFGPSLFEKDGEDRFGLAKNKPGALEEIPPLPGDALEEERSGGDLCVQACADAPRWRSTRSGTSSGSPVARRSFAGLSSVSGGRRARARHRQHRATSWASRTAPTT